MRITALHIENFRSIKSLDLDLGETTVFIGPNNAGKTAILDAIRIALTRRWGQRGTGFTEYDIHLAKEGDDPKTSPGVVIELRAEEAVAGEWPDEMQQALDEISQTDPVTGKSSITLNVQCAWSEPDGCFQPVWTFLNNARQPLVGGSARRVNLERFWQYVPVFYLGALRDADDEFTARSQFWGRLLKAMEIPPRREGRVQKVLDRLNTRLLDADPRLAQIAETLSGANRVAARDREGDVNLRLVPLKSWDLLSKAEIILRNEPDWPWLPLQRHGQGMQSLTVIFLFQAFVHHLLAELYEPESTPILALEEPETHLHPQAARTLWGHVSKLPGQKIITTHSPFFVQHVPFRDLRMVRLTENGTARILDRYNPFSLTIQRRQSNCRPITGARLPSSRPRTGLWFTMRNGRAARSLLSPVRRIQNIRSQSTLACGSLILKKKKPPVSQRKSRSVIRRSGEQLPCSPGPRLYSSV
jgi:putative ATP-dependent endonuclease of OLD family